MSTSPSGFERAEYYNAPPVAPFESGVFFRAIAFSLIGVVAGAIVNACFLIFLPFNIGFFALIVGWLVSKAMMVGSDGKGGRPYQLAAVVLTLISVALSNSIAIYWFSQKQHSISLTLAVVVKLFVLGFSAPFLDVAASPGSGLIGLLIIFVGARAAWRMASGNPAAVRHPFAR